MVSNLKIAIAQGDIRYSNIPDNLNYWQCQLEKIPSDTQLVMLPETFNTGFMTDPKTLAETMDGRSVQWLKEQSKRYNTAICTTLMIREDEKIFNRFCFVKSDGTLSYYDKQHLFRFGGEADVLTSGNRRVVIELMGWKMLPVVCYDLRFPISSYNRWTEKSEYEYDVMLVCANWPSSRIKVWDALLKARAIENQCFVAAVNRIGVDVNEIQYNGHSQIIDAKGNVKLKAAKDENTILSIELNNKKLKTFRQRFCTGQDQCIND